ncbi:MULTISPECIES: thioredoxin [Paenibacillus]|uniref:Thioredoxin n=1 Tax=Paenibacillus radicis (ex Xue et al. 2023) TaxID=2972489 RepID=A0ABT1YPS9_9BACL|nr:thioredoxin [Paenibacillus radicis (ex Xue et al. 2023)]MCR8635183.1 thioredoxin [Paenibacillus radicis (ex Xue et al. 2023)]
MALTVAENDAMLKSLISEGVVLVDYGAPWCGPCKALLPVLEEIDQEMTGKVRIVKVNCEDLPASAAEAGVMGMPTVIVYKEGQPLDKIVGLRPKAQYRNVLEKHL